LCANCCLQGFVRILTQQNTVQSFWRRNRLIVYFRSKERDSMHHCFIFTAWRYASAVYAHYAVNFLSVRLSDAIRHCTKMA